MHVIVKYVNTSLWSEALDLIKLTVSKSSSLTTFVNSTNQTNPKFFLGSQLDAAAGLSAAQQIPTQAFFSKKELPGRTLEFDFDFTAFVPSQLSNASAAGTAGVKPVPPLNLLNFNKQSTQLVQSSVFVNGWKRPYMSQNRTREKIFLLLNTLNKNQAVTKMVNTPVSLTNGQTEENIKVGLVFYWFTKC